MSANQTITHSINCADLFPIPFFIDNFGESAKHLNARLVGDIRQEMIARPVSATRSFISAWQSQSGLERQYEAFATLQQQIELSARTYLRHINYADPSAARCGGLWANYVAGRGAHSVYHMHGSGRVVATGVYYPASLLLDGESPIQYLDDFDPKDIFAETGVGGELIIYDPSYTTKRQLIKPQNSPYYDAQKQLAPRESVLVMFPQYLPHSVDPLLADNIERFSISYTIELSTTD